jgi:hypothetical protein
MVLESINWKLVAIVAYAMISNGAIGAIIPKTIGSSVKKLIPAPVFALVNNMAIYVGIINISIC